MPIIFKAKTQDGYVIKILAELLQSNIKTANFEINEKGIYLKTADEKSCTMIEMELNADNFSKYRYVPQGRGNLKLGINLTHLHKMLKSIKKRDSLQFFIDSDCPTDLGIKIIPKEKGRVTTSSIKIQDMQRIDIVHHANYGKAIIVNSGEFQKMCKGLAQISNTTTIKAKGASIKFINDTVGLMKRSTEFGENDDSDDEWDDDEKEEVYEDVFDTDQLTKITKLAALNTTMNIYVREGESILFKTQVGTLGHISVYLKSKSIYEKDSKVRESEEEEEEA